MSKCIRCRENEGIYPHYNGGKVCGECLDYYFQCPDCTVVYDIDDREHYDAGGFCPKHVVDH
jgi:NifB/MoaA-like Fe-S oxidoreductase|nr:MAG TPA: DNA-directed RNA polymerase [Caudoviricetes sp.]